MLAEKRRLRPQPIKVAHEIERVRRLTDAAREAHARLANEETAEHLAALEAELTALEDQLQSHAESAIDKRARSINAINKKNRCVAGLWMLGRRCCPCPPHSSLCGGHAGGDCLSLSPPVRHKQGPQL